MIELKLSCENEGRHLTLKEGCNMIVLESSQGLCDDIEKSVYYTTLVAGGFLTDLRPWLPIKNYLSDGTKIDTTPWWDKVRNDLNDAEFWQQQYLKTVQDRDKLRVTKDQLVEYLRERGFIEFKKMGEYLRDYGYLPMPIEMKERFRKIYDRHQDGG